LDELGSLGGIYPVTHQDNSIEVVIMGAGELFGQNEHPYQKSSGKYFNFDWINLKYNLEATP
jgi:hypothetical protein